MNLTAASRQAGGLACATRAATAKRARKVVDFVNMIAVVCKVIGGSCVLAVLSFCGERLAASRSD